MFLPNSGEWENLKWQNATSSWGGRRSAPNVFTEFDVLMLSSVVNSEQALQVNIQIMRIFAKIRQHLTDNTELRLEIIKIKNAVEKISRKQDGQDKNMELVFEYIDRLQDKIEEPISKKRKKIGFNMGDKE